MASIEPPYGQKCRCDTIHQQKCSSEILFFKCFENPQTRPPKFISKSSSRRLEIILLINTLFYEQKNLRNIFSKHTKRASSRQSLGYLFSARSPLIKIARGQKGFFNIQKIPPEKIKQPKIVFLWNLDKANHFLCSIRAFKCVSFRWKIAFAVSQGEEEDAAENISSLFREAFSRLK